MTWSDILSLVRALEDRFRADGSVAWYRGHRDVAWELQSAIHRHIDRLTSCFTRSLPETDKIVLLRDEYKMIYRRFKADAWPLLAEAERSDWGVLFAMQHFGLPTRLLDWTESFACAVFFAQLRRKRHDCAAVWVLDPQALNKLSIKTDGILSLDEDTAPAAVIDPRAWHPKWTPPQDPLPTIAVAPIFTNARMVAQRSTFTLTGDTFTPLDRHSRGHLASDGRLVKLVLRPEMFDDAEEYLSTAGLTAFNYYPDLEGLALKHEARVERTIRDAKAFYPKFFA